MVLCRDELISVRHFQFDHAQVVSGSSFGVDGIAAGITLHEMEKRLILSTLAQENNNRTKASEVLGISVRTLRNKLNEYSGEGIQIK